MVDRVTVAVAEPDDTLGIRVGVGHGRAAGDDPRQEPGCAEGGDHEEADDEAHPSPAER